MYAQALGLHREPFSIAPDPRTLFLSERHREALAHLVYGAQAGGGFVLLTGVVGAGKTTVCRAFLEQLPAGCRVAYLFNPQLSSLELLQAICDEFGIDYPAGPPESAKRFIDPLNRFLLERHAAGEHCLCIVDEAQRLAPEVLEQLRLLTNLETNEAKLLQVMLVGQPELRELLARPDLTQLAQRVVARWHLEGLDEADTARYVAHRLQVAGLKQESPFDARCLRLLHRLSGGIPRRINLIADRALLALYATRGTRVTPALLQKAAAEVLGEEPARSAWRWPWALGAGAGGVLLLGALWAWMPGPTPSPAALLPALGTQPPSTSPAPPLAAPPELPTGFAPEAGLRALAQLWDEAGEPCTAASRLRCWQGPLSLSALQSLDRPGLLDLRDDAGQPRTLLLLRLDGEHAKLLGSDGKPQSWPLLDLLRRWNGGYQTLWQSPPPGSAWLDDALREAGVPPEGTRRERIARFQAANQLKSDGYAGPLTLMRLQRSRELAGPSLTKGQD